MLLFNGSTNSTSLYIMYIYIEVIRGTCCVQDDLDKI